MRIKLSKYRQILLLSFILLFSFMPLSLLSAKEELTEIVKRITPAVVYITTYDSEGEVIGYGTGFFISKDGDIITSRHVLIGASRAEIKVAKEKTYPIMKIVAEDMEGDLVRVSVDIPGDMVYPLSVT